MKTVVKLLSVCLLMMALSSTINAQKDFLSTKKPAQIGFSGNLTDFSASLPKVGNVDPGYSIWFWKGLTNHLDYSVRYNGLFSDYQPITGVAANKNSYKNEGEFSFHLKALSDNHLLNPFISAGIGAGNYQKKNISAYAPLGIGLQLNLFSEAYVYLQGNYRMSFNDKKLDNNTFYSFGVAQPLVRKKAVEFKEIPVAVIEVKDTDNDGVPDTKDKCPTVYGPAENNGCPWPDTDGDGVLDKDDKCPTVKGPAENNGCPWPDRDGDGVLDKDDKCPDEKGLPENNGCPKVEEVISKKMENIYFDFNKASITASSDATLNEVAELIKTTNGETFVIIGMTDKKGSDKYNLNLSQKRAASVMAALEKRGVAASQLKSKGIGEAEAVVDENASEEERMKDRKVIVRTVSGDEWIKIKKKDTK